MQLLVSIIDSEKRSLEVSTGASTLGAQTPHSCSKSKRNHRIFHPSGCSSHAFGCGRCRGNGAELSKSAIKSLAQGSRDACMDSRELVLPTAGTSRSYLDDGVDQRKAPALLAQLCICFHEGLQLLWQRRSHRQQVIAGISTRRD